MASRPTWIRRLIAVLLAGFAFVFLGWMCWVGQNVPYGEQQKLYEMLRNVEGTMFAVFGLWIALLYPELRKKVFGRSQSRRPSSEDCDSDNESEDKQADHLLQPFFMSLFILLVTVVVDVVGPLIKRVDVFVEYSSAVRGLSYALIGVLAMCQILSILRAMRITDGLKSAISRARGEQKIKNRIRQNRK